MITVCALTGNNFSKMDRIQRNVQPSAVLTATDQPSFPHMYIKSKSKVIPLQARYGPEGG